MFNMYSRQTDHVPITCCHEKVTNTLFLVYLVSFLLNSWQGKQLSFLDGKGFEIDICKPELKKIN